MDVRLALRDALCAVTCLAVLAGCGADGEVPDPPDEDTATVDDADREGRDDDLAAPDPDADEPGDVGDDADDPDGDDGTDGSGTGADDDGQGPEGDWDEQLADWPATRVTVTAAGETHELTARIAAEPADRRQGLMGIEHLPDDAGMLFAFPEDRDGGFWMKDTLVPLDIAFADADGTIVAVEEMEPCEEDPCPTYEPGTTYRVALEVPGGWLDERDVGVGDEIAWDHLPEAR